MTRHDATGGEASTPGPNGTSDEASTAGSVAAISKALGHPLRLRIVYALVELKEAGPKQISDYLGESLGNVSYHVRSLLAKEVVELVRTEPRRGAVLHVYAVTDPMRSAVRALSDQLKDAADPWDAAVYSTLSSQVDFRRRDLHRILIEYPDSVTRLGSALSDPVRVQILGLLVKNPQLTVAEIARGLGVKADAVEPALDVLEHAGVLKSEAEVWSVCRPGVEALTGIYNVAAAHSKRLAV